MEMLPLDDEIMDPEVMELLFPDVGDLPAKEFSSFIYHFSIAYTVAVENIDRYCMVSQRDILEDIETYKKEFSELLHSSWQSEPMSLTRLFMKDLGKNELYFEKISKQSPLSLCAKGIITALTLAVIVSGGEFEGFGIRVKMKPLGEGIWSLRKALFTRMDVNDENHR
ncbi:MAG: hypothetical protein JW915_10525 [Chitinispirillaceae bacterium]|nr:hypothetical protein [Chitinispirillaceae bacterium]